MKSILLVAFLPLSPSLQSKIEIEVHLSGLRVGGLPKFQINDCHATESQVIEHQVRPTPFINNTVAPLPSHDAKVITDSRRKVSR